MGTVETFKRKSRQKRIQIETLKLQLNSLIHQYESHPYLPLKEEISSTTSVFGSLMNEIILLKDFIVTVNMVVFINYPMI